MFQQEGSMSVLVVFFCFGTTFKTLSSVKMERHLCSWAELRVENDKLPKTCPEIGAHLCQKKKAHVPFHAGHVQEIGGYFCVHQSTGERVYSFLPSVVKDTETQADTHGFAQAHAHPHPQQTVQHRRRHNRSVSTIRERNTH